MYTSHGHHIAGTSMEVRPEGNLATVARCGGPGLCEQCSREAAPHAESSNRVQSERAQAVLDEAYEALIRAVGKSQAHDCIQELQNAGVYFVKRL